MPAFVTNGPNIPEHLLQAHEDGQVVFFCGAGISTPAGLPLFKGLVDAIYKQLGTSKNSIETKAYEKNQFDSTLDLLERRIPGQRIAVRSKIADILKPKWRKKGATSTHEALLQLATDRKGSVRIVTTNFDRIFQRVIQRNKLNIPSLSAPLLPIPKPSRWHGLVHLHGLLPDGKDDTALNRLVLSSGDFGLAYLTERWAARFVSELFRYYTVCFVGYAINDPVLRYMMDALAADELLGESKPEAYAFASYRDGEEEDTVEEWEAKGVVPLLYKVPLGTQDHSTLHDTLIEWANTYRDGVRGKEMIIAQHATTPPLGPSTVDYAVGRVLWALTDGLAAKHFAELNPVPPLKWLEPFSESQFKHRDLNRFGVTANSKNDDKLNFSMIRRPSPYTLSPLMSIVDFGLHGSNWDQVMFQLARWLIRHLGDPALIIWLANNGGQLHERFLMLVSSRMEELARLIRDNKQEELDRIRADAPKSIPDEIMRILWRILLAGRVKSFSRRFDLYDWLRRVKYDGISPTLCAELREILKPCITIRAPFRYSEEPDVESRPTRVKDYVEWELELASEYTHSALQDMGKNDAWQVALPELLQDFTLLLRDALDLSRELGGADDKSDLSYINQPSISDHSQNRDFHDWTILITLTRDAWLALLNKDRERAKNTAEGWWQIQYPVFKRLSFFASTQDGVISCKKSLKWLLENDSWWLWSIETQREVMRLLVSMGSKFSDAELRQLENAIVSGPPLEMFRTDAQEAELARVIDRETWLRFAKLRSSGAALSEEAITKLAELEQLYPEWRLAEDESDEFSFWMGEGDEWRKFIKTPRGRRELVEWLKEHPSTDPWNQDDWRQRCSDEFPATSCALYALTRENIWPADRWREALQAWTEEKLIKRSWRYMGEILNAAPDDFVLAIVHGISYWLQSIARTFGGNEGIFFNIIQRILNLDVDANIDTDDPVMRAINHPIGYVTEALLRWWYRGKLEDGKRLPRELSSMFTELCNTNVERYRHGRILLATHAIVLYRVDPEWARINLLPLFDWQISANEASAAWEGFLWSPRLYRPFISAIKGSFLETAGKYQDLGKHAEQFAAFLTFAALDPGDTFTNEELSDALQVLPATGLSSSAKALVRALESSSEQREEYWRYRVLPFLRNIWPKSSNLMTPTISESLARLCIAAKGSFPEAFQELQHWLQGVQHADYLVHILHLSELCTEFPEETLVFLNSIIGDELEWLPRELQQCLEQIQNTNLQITHNAQFIRLTELIRRRGVA